MDRFERGQPEPVRHPRRLLWEIPFRIDSSLPIETCIDRIFSIDNSSKWFTKRKKRVKIYQFEDGTIYFHILVPRPPVSGWLIGYLEQTDNYSVTVYGKIGIDAIPIYGLLLFAGCLSFIFLATPSGFLISPIFFGVMFYSAWHDGKEIRNELKMIIEEKLSS